MEELIYYLRLACYAVIFTTGVMLLFTCSRYKAYSVLTIFISTFLATSLITTYILKAGVEGYVVYIYTPIVILWATASLTYMLRQIGK